eukprot:1838318-Pyramimonas_sp.AAC.1
MVEAVDAVGLHGASSNELGAPQLCLRNRGGGVQQHHVGPKAQPRYPEPLSPRYLPTDQLPWHVEYHHGTASNHVETANNLAWPVQEKIL